MKTLLLASVLSSAPALATEKSTPITAHNPSYHIQEVTDSTGIQITIILGSIFLGSSLAYLADSEYRKRTPPEKRISARVLKKLGEMNV